ncbi:MAG: DUF177 domain-containing protein [Qipengyuania sp.]|jgi:hypothetical protein|nr:DUF177 domain-containing protein [Qipengyuania sp.]
MSSGEFVRLVKLDRLPSAALTIEASESERAALAERFALPSIERLHAVTTLRRTGDAIDATGRLDAAFHQRCAISDEPFANRLDAPLAIRFVPTLAPGSDDEEMEFGADEPDEIEYDGASFDLGEAVAQSFGLALDPYAVGPDAEAVRRESGILDDNAPSGPFAALAALKTGSKES